jgi:hypothetical protein
MTAEEVDQHLEANTNVLTLEAKLPNLCAIYHAVRPVLKFIHGFLFWKPKWRDFVDKLTEALDGVCVTDIQPSPMPKSDTNAGGN